MGATSMKMSSVLKLRSDRSVRSASAAHRRRSFDVPDHSSLNEPNESAECGESVDAG